LADIVVRLVDIIELTGLACQGLGGFMATPESESFVRTFARGLAVIEVMGRGASHLTLGEVAEGVGLPRTAVRRFLMTLMELSFVQTDGKHYWLTLPYWRQAQVTLEELCGRAKQSCALSVLDGEDIVYIQRQHTKRILPMSPSLGSRLPAHAVSMGRVMLSALPDEALDAYLASATFHQLTSATVTDPARLREHILLARTQGFAWIDGELDDAISGLAVPVRDKNGHTIAAVNVSLPAGQFGQEEAVRLFLGDLRQAASQLRATTV
jgi:IclR family pca regulon transcriptional regulator